MFLSIFNFQPPAGAIAFPLDVGMLGGSLLAFAAMAVALTGVLVWVLASKRLVASVLFVVSWLCCMTGVISVINATGERHERAVSQMVEAQKRYYDQHGEFAPNPRVDLADDAGLNAHDMAEVTIATDGKSVLVESGSTRELVRAQP